MQSENAKNEAAKPPISQSQLLANLANSLHSTGPKTAAGKSKSKMNALRHGLTGQFYVMNEADRLAYTEFERGILRALTPVGEYEQQLATNIAQNHWRLNRARAIEYNNFGLGHEDFAPETNTESPEVEAAITQARTWLRDHPAITNLTLYETRIDRMITKNKRELDDLQAKRKVLEAAARDEAEKLLRLELRKGKTVDKTRTIQVNGFDFSTTALLTAMNRKDALEEAKFYETHGWNTPKTWSGPLQTLPIAA